MSKQLKKEITFTKQISECEKEPRRNPRSGYSIRNKKAQEIDLNSRLDIVEEEKKNH